MQISKFFLGRATAGRFLYLKMILLKCFHHIVGIHGDNLAKEPIAYRVALAIEGDSTLGEEEITVILEKLVERGIQDCSCHHASHHLESL